MAVILWNYYRIWVTNVESNLDSIAHYIYFYTIGPFIYYDPVSLFKKQQTKINMTVNPYQVNYKKYFIFLEFDFQIMLPLLSQS